MRLIDADKLKTHYSWWTDETKELFDTIINLQPTIEAEPIRHGRWIFSEDRYWKTCPGCGAEVDVSMGLGIFVDGIEVDEMNYCPNCGSKMDL